MNLWVITVNFGDPNKSTKVLIDSLSLCNKADLIKVGIADNSSTHESSNQLKEIKNQKKLDIKIFQNEKNLYYWPAAKKVLHKLKNINNSYPDWLMICNNDITFTDSDLLNKLIKINKKKYPIIGPDIISSSGKKINPFLIDSPSFLKNLYWKIYYSSYVLSIFLSIINKLWKKFFIRLDGKKEEKMKQVYAVHGAAIFFSSYFFERGGWLDDNFELFGEEMTVAKIAQTLDIPITYFPEIKILHHEHTNTKNIDRKTTYKKGKKSFQYLQTAFNK